MGRKKVILNTVDITEEYSFVTIFWGQNFILKV
jgi:hypothetical protein